MTVIGRKSVNIVLNGEPKTIPDSLSVAQLVEYLQLAGALVAVEINRIVVRRADHSATMIHEGDIVEIVHFVGGG